MTRYVVGGLGGDVERNWPCQPPSLVRGWDRDEHEWRFAGLWRPYDDGAPVPDGLALDWPELLDQFGPISDTPPAPFLAITRRPLRAADHQDIAEDQRHVRLADGDEDHL